MSVKERFGLTLLIMGSGAFGLGGKSGLAGILAIIAVQAVGVLFFIFGEEQGNG